MSQEGSVKETKVEVEDTAELNRAAQLPLFTARRIVQTAIVVLVLLKTIVDLGFRLEADSPEGKPWRDWVYTKEFRRYHMKTRDGERPA